MRVSKKFVRLGTGADEISASDLPSNFTSPSNYTPDSTDVKGHLSGVDTELAGRLEKLSDDIDETSASLSDNQASAANVTGLAFNSANVRSAVVDYSIVIDATADLYESGTLQLTQQSGTWGITQEATGDDTLVELNVTAAGQVTYTTPSYAGFVSGTIRFRATTTKV